MKKVFWEGLALGLFVFFALLLFSRQVAFSDKELLEEGVRGEKTSQENNQITLGVLPHDIFASFIITDFFQRLSFQNPKTIIILGPNHYEKGNFKVLTSLFSWETPFGQIFPDELIIKDLLAENLVEVDEEVLKNEHAVGALLPFLKFYLPETTIVPLVLSSRLDFEEIGVLAQKLLTYQKEGVVILASIDFSHNLRSKEAQLKDDSTLGLMKSFSYREILTLDDRYLDSPPSLATILMMAEKLGKSRFKVFYHTNSAEIAKNEWLPTTSYFSGAFY